MPGVEPNPPLGRLEERSRLFESFYLVFRRIAADVPLILVVEVIGIWRIVRALWSAQLNPRPA